MDESSKRGTRLEANGNTFECNVDPIHMPTIERILRRSTSGDELVSALLIPRRPLWLAVIVRILRCYRKRISTRLGNRCVFEPSCSHYSEYAFRKKGFWKGFALTIHRLIRCRPGAGGVDWP